MSNEKKESVQRLSQDRESLIEGLAEKVRVHNEKVDEIEPMGTDDDQESADDQEITDESENETSDEVSEGEDDSTDDDSSEETDDSEESDEQKVYEIKVNGKTKKVTLQQLIAHAQKIEAADEYLAEAKSKAIHPDAEANSKGNPGETEDSRENSQIDLTKAPLSQDAVVKVIRETVELEKAVEWFKETYKDIAEDPNLWKLAVEKDEELQKTFKGSFKDRFAKVGDELRGWTNKFKPAKSEFDKRLEKKNGMKTVPNGSSMKTSKTGFQEESASDVIKELARQRSRY